MGTYKQMHEGLIAVAKSDDSNPDPLTGAMDDWLAELSVEFAPAAVSSATPCMLDKASMVPMQRNRNQPCVKI